LKPSVIKIDFAHILLTHIASATVLRAGQDDKVIDYCRQCQVQLACHTSLTTPIATIPARQEHCSTVNDNATVLHTVNLAMLRHWFDPIDLGSLQGQSLVSDNLNISYPPFKLLNTSNYAARMANDRKYALDLAKSVLLKNRTINYFMILRIQLNMTWTQY
jgi:hypothetical protein